MSTDRTKRKVALAVIAGLALLTVLLVCSLVDRVWYVDSPDGQYRVWGYVLDKGGWGFGGRYYLKENRPFAPWHRLGDGPCSCEWLSNDTFRIDGYSGEAVYSVSTFTKSPHLGLQPTAGEQLDLFEEEG